MGIRVLVLGDRNRNVIGDLKKRVQQKVHHSFKDNKLQRYPSVLRDALRIRSYFRDSQHEIPKYSRCGSCASSKTISGMVFNF